MKTIIYAGGRVLTGDAIAAAVLRCGQVLAEKGTAETVDIPARRADGTPYTAAMLIGPASQILIEDAPGTDDELVDADAEQALHAVVRTHAPTVTVCSEPVDEPDWLEEI